MPNSNANNNASPAKQGQEIINPRRVNRAAGFVTLGNCCRCGRSLSLSRCNKTGARCSFEGAQYDTEGNFLYDAATKPARHRVERNAQETPREKVQTIAAPEPAPKYPTATLKHRVRRSPASLGGSFYWLEVGQLVTIYSTSGDAARVATFDNLPGHVSEDFFSISLAHLEMTPREELTKEETFFYRMAGFSYNAQNETPEQGKVRGARSLALAERRAKARGFTFTWQIDADSDSSEFSDEEPAWSVWECRCLNTEGQAVAILGGVDFGRDGSPFGAPYARVVQAEMAAELDLEEAQEPQPRAPVGPVASLAAAGKTTMPLPNLYTRQARELIDISGDSYDASPMLEQYTDGMTAETLFCGADERLEFEREENAEIEDSELPHALFVRLFHFLQAHHALGELNDDQPAQPDQLATLAPFLALALTVAGSAPLGDLQPQQLYTVNLTGEEIMKARALAATTPKA